MTEKARSEILLEFAKIELDLTKHLEVQRERFTALLVIVGGISLASVGWDRKIDPSDWIQGAFLLFISVLGFLQSVKLQTKMHMHHTRYGTFRAELDKVDESYSIVEVKNKGQAQFLNDNWHTFIVRLRSYQIWLMFPIALGMVGATILYQSY